MRYRTFGDRLGSVSALTVRLDDHRHKGSSTDWRDFVFAALEAGINSFEIGQTTPGLLNGAAEALAAVERRLFVVSWRTNLAGGAGETAGRIDEMAATLGLQNLDLVTLELEGPLRDPGVMADLRQAEKARWYGVFGPNNVLDESILRGDFDGMALRLDPEGGWNERNRIKAAGNRGMGVIAMDVGMDFGGQTTEPAKPGFLKRLIGWQGPQMSPAFRIDVPGWTEQQVAIALTLTDPCISSIVVQPTCIPNLESLAWCVERDLPAGAQAQIEMARFSMNPEQAAPPKRRRRA